jgi:hypothetical protein
MRNERSLARWNILHLLFVRASDDVVLSVKRSFLRENRGVRRR